MGSRAPLGTKDLWNTKGVELPGYVREIARALMRDHGMDKSRAIATAVATVKRWAAGGGNVTAKTRAEAGAAVAEWEKAKAQAHATPNKTNLSNTSEAVELAEPGKVHRFRHGWIPIGPDGKDITDPKKLDAQQRTMLEVQHRRGNLHPDAAKLVGKDGSVIDKAAKPETRSVSRKELASGKLDESKMGPAELAFRRAQQAKKDAKASASKKTSETATGVRLPKGATHVVGSTVRTKEGVGKVVRASSGNVQVKFPDGSSSNWSPSAVRVVKFPAGTAIPVGMKVNTPDGPGKVVRSYQTGAQVAIPGKPGGNYTFKALSLSNDLTDTVRSVLAKKKEALPDGSFPIRNEEDLKNAIQAHGRAKNPAAAKAWIIKRAKALKLTELLPESWEKDGGSDEATENEADDKLEFANSSNSSGSQQQQDQKTSGKRPGYKAQSQYLPPGAVGYTHGWQPVDANGNKVGKPLTQEQRDAAGHDQGTKDAIHKAYENKAKADGKKAEAQQKKDANKAASDAKKSEAAKAKLASEIVKQAQADQKAGRELTPAQKDALDKYNAAVQAKTDALRNGKAPASNSPSGSSSAPKAKAANNAAHFDKIIKQYKLGPGDYEVYNGPDKTFEDGSTRKNGDKVLTAQGAKKVADATKAAADAKAAKAKKTTTTNLATPVKDPKPGQRYRHGWIPIGAAVETMHGSGTLVSHDDSKAKVRLNNPPGKKTGDALVTLDKDKVHRGSGALAKARKDAAEHGGTRDDNLEAHARVLKARGNSDPFGTAKASKKVREESAAPKGVTTAPKKSVDSASRQMEASDALRAKLAAKHGVAAGTNAQKLTKKRSTGSDFSKLSTDELHGAILEHMKSNNRTQLKAAVAELAARRKKTELPAYKNGRKLGANQGY